MFSRQTPKNSSTTPSRSVAVPSRGALRALRSLVLSSAAAATTLGTIGGLCTLASVSYDIHRKTKIAEQIIEQKNQLQTTCPNYRVREPIRRKYASVADTNGQSSTSGGTAVGTTAAYTGHDEGTLESPSATHREREPVATCEPLSPTCTRSIESLPQSSSPVDAIQSSDSPFPSSLFSRGLNQKIDSHELSIKSIARARLANFSLRYANKDDYISLNTRMHRLLRDGKVIEATQNFLDLYIGSLKYSRASRREAAVTLFYANLKDDNIQLARNIFQSLEKHFTVTPALWELMLLALGKEGRPETIADLYLKYSHAYVLPKNLSVMVIRALLDTYRIEDAKDFAYRYLYRDDDCAIVGLYLLGVWKSSRKVDMVEAQFTQFVKTFARRRRQVTEKLFEPMLKAFIESGHEEQAADLIRGMTNEFGVPPGLRIMGLIAYSKALECDWEAVEADLRAIHASGVAKLHPHKFTKIFHRIFLEYSVANSGKKIYDFVMMGIKEWEIQPDQVLFERIMKIFVERGTREMIDAVVGIAEAEMWDVKFDKEQLLESIRSSRLSIELCGYSLWDMYRAQKQKQSYASLSNRVLGYDISNIPLQEAYQLPWSHQPLQWWKNAMHLRDPGKPLNQFLPLHAQMLHFIQVGRTDQALLLYRLAKESGFIVKRMHVELAMSASIIKEGGIRGAQEILEEEHTVRGFGFGNPVTPFYFQQILDVQADEITKADACKMAVFGFYNLLERKLLPFCHNFVANVSSEMIKRGEADVALDLLRTVCKSRYGAMVPFDDFTVKVLVRGFAHSGNLKGVRWAIFTALHRPEILTRPLVTELLRNLEALRLAEPDKHSNVSQETFKAYLKHLSRLADLLSLKYEASLPKYQREALSRHGPIEVTQDGRSVPDVVASLISKNKVRIAESEYSGPTSDAKNTFPSPSPPTTMDENVESDGPRRSLRFPVLDSDDIREDPQCLDTIVATWRERVELDRCLGGCGDRDVNGQGAAEGDDLQDEEAIAETLG
ncbi:hypothetical protein KEM54_006281 [Ascosphaera aggregata]|nr:hypothetical protein KEM54_006281 [Ascosphaera aggregata]